MPNSKKPFKAPTLENSQVIFEESIIKIKKDRLKIDHLNYDYYSLITKPFAVVILATTSDEEYILTEEYRHPTGHFLLGCPGGFIDEGESPLEAAKRELLEETGYEALSLELLGSAYPYAGISAQKTYYVRAYQAQIKQTPRLEKSEIIRVRLIHKDLLTSTIKKNLELDGTLCTALFFNR